MFFNKSYWKHILQIVSIPLVLQKSSWKTLEKTKRVVRKLFGERIMFIPDCGPVSHFVLLYLSYGCPRALLKSSDSRGALVLLMPGLSHKFRALDEMYV